FFQAEDGIRDLIVTGVQTCALPIYAQAPRRYFRASDCLRAKRGFCIPKAALLAAGARCLGIPARVAFADVRNHLSTKKLLELMRSEERRVGKECRSRGWQEYQNRKI